MHMQSIVFYIAAYKGRPNKKMAILRVHNGLVLKLHYPVVLKFVLKCKFFAQFHVNLANFEPASKSFKTWGTFMTRLADFFTGNFF